MEAVCSSETLLILFQISEISIYTSLFVYVLFNGDFGNSEYIVKWLADPE
jgi:hypothetical protein